MTKRDEICRRVWGNPIGTTKAGCAIYRSIIGNYAVERDFCCLCGPTPEEMEEIRNMERREEKE